MASFSGVQVNLWCRDVERCAAFFRGLGLPERFRFPRTGAPDQLEVEAAGVRIGLSSALAGERLFGIVAEPGSDTELVLWCDEVDELYAAATTVGGTALTPPTDSPDGRLRFAWVLDPEGHRVKFVRERG